MDSFVCRRNSAALFSILVFALLVALQGSALAQQPSHLDWRRIGNQLIHHPTGDLASGPVERVWFTATGIAVLLPSGAVWERSDGGQWQLSNVLPPEAEQRRSGLRWFRADGNDVLRSDDGGESWSNLTRFRESSILGSPVTGVAVSEIDPDRVVAVNRDGVWGSADGGLTWAGENDGLPNFPAQRISSLPTGVDGARVETETAVLEWLPGQKIAWTPVGAGEGRVISDVEPLAYEGYPDGGISARVLGVERLPAKLGTGPVKAIWVDPSDGYLAIAVSGTRLYRTFNGGLFWDDITGSLSAGALHGIAAHPATQSLYVASDQGVFYGKFSFQAVGTATGWHAIGGPGLPSGKALDVRLDAAGNQLYVIASGYGLYAAMAPHRHQFPVVVSAADGLPRAAAPGSLVTVIGQTGRNATAGGRPVPLLPSAEGETQMQLPFDVQGPAVPLRLENGSNEWNFTLPLESAAPAIFVDRDGTPIVLDADSGVLLDALNPARSSMRLQILATGLGRVDPEWIAGREAPVENPPKVTAPVRVVLDGEALEVTRATLAPGYVGFYLIEAEIRGILSHGTAELYLEVDGRPTNRVRVYIEP